MRGHLVVLQCAMIAVALICGQPALAQSSATDEESVRAGIDATTIAFNEHEASSWVRLCTPDAQLVTARGESLNGVSEIERGLTAIFEGRNRRATVKAQDVRVRFVTADVAVGGSDRRNRVTDLCAFQIRQNTRAIESSTIEAILSRSYDAVALSVENADLRAAQVAACNGPVSGINESN